MKRRVIISMLVCFFMISFTSNTLMAKQDAVLSQVTVDQINRTVEAKHKDLEKNLMLYIDSQLSKTLDEKFNRAESSLKDQSKDHFQSMNKLFDETRKSFEWLVEKGIWVIGILTIISIAVGSFLFWKHYISLPDLIKKQKEIFDEQKEIFDEQKDLFDRLTEKNQKQRSDIEKLIEEKDYLIKQIEKITEDYTHKKVVWTYEVKDKDIDASYEIGNLRAVIEVKEIEPGDESGLQPEDCDLMIYYYRNKENAEERLKEIGRFIIASGKNIPLIIYTYQSDRIPPEHLSALEGYKNYVLANMPLTLKSYFNSLIRT